MLHEFVTVNRDEIITPLPGEGGVEVDSSAHRGGDRSRRAAVPRSTGRRAAPRAVVEPGDRRSAILHGHDLLLRGFTVSQVVHDYGDVCQSITELAMEMGAPDRHRGFPLLNGCLDDAMAGAVTEYGRERQQSTIDGESLARTSGWGSLRTNCGNLIRTALIAFEVVKSGNVGVGGSTGTVLHRSLIGARDLIGRSLAEVRLTQGVQIGSHFR